MNGLLSRDTEPDASAQAGHEQRSCDAVVRRCRARIGLRANIRNQQIVEGALMTTLQGALHAIESVLVGERAKPSLRSFPFGIRSDILSLVFEECLHGLFAPAPAPFVRSQRRLRRQRVARAASIWDADPC